MLQVWNNVTDSELLQKLLRNELHINGTWAELRSLRQQIFFHALRPAAQYYQSKRPVKSPEGLKVNTREERQAPWFILNSDDIDGMKITDDKLKSRNWYRPDQSEMSAFMADLDTPFSGGISGTTRDVTLQLTNLFGPLNVREYWTLQLFNAAQMINNGYHSFFEALYVAAFLEDRFVDQQQCIGKQLRDTFDALRQRAKRGEILNGQLYEQTLALILPKLDNSVAARYLPPEYGRQHHLLATESNRFRDLMSIGQLHRRVWVFSRQKEPDCNDILQALDRLRVTSGREGIEMAFILQNQLRNHQMWYPDSGSNPAFKELDQQIEQRLFSTTRITAADRANLVQIAEQQPTLAAELYYKLDQAQDSLPEFAELPDGLLIESHVAKEQGTVNKIKSGLQEIQQPANDDKRAREVDATKAKGEHTSSLLTPEEKQAIKNRGVFERKILSLEALQPEMQRAAEGLRKLPGYQGTVYYSPMPLNTREVTLLFGRLKPGQVMSYRGLLTTDASVETIKALRTPNEGRVIYVLEGITVGYNTAGITDRNTAEILLNPGQYFRVTATQKVGDHLYVILKQEVDLTAGETIRDLHKGNLAGFVDYDSVSLGNDFKSIFNYPDLNQDQSIRIRNSALPAGRSSSTDEIPFSGSLSGLGVAQRDNIANWAMPEVAGERAVVGGETPRKRRIIVQLEDDAESLRSAIALADKHPGEAAVYQLDVQGQMRPVYGDPTVLGGSGEVELLLVGHGRGGVGDVQNNTSLAGYTAHELAALPRQISQKLALHSQINKLVLMGCALVNHDDKKSGFLFDAAAALAQQTGQKPAQLVAYASELSITAAVVHERKVGHRHQFVEGRIGEPARQARMSLAFDSQRQRYFPAFVFSIQQEEGEIASKQPIVTEGWHPNARPLAITPADEIAIKTSVKEQTRVELQQLERMANRLIKHYEQALTQYYKKEYRFFGFENVGDQVECIFKTTADQQDKRVMVKHDSNNAVLFLEEKPSAQQGALPGRRIALQYGKDGDVFRFSVVEGLSGQAGVSRENAVFTQIRDKMLLLEPEIAQAEGISTMNLAFLALHLLSQPHDDDLSPWKKFVGMANLGQILHGIGQDIGTLVRTVKLLRGAGAQAEGLLGKLLGGTAYTHSGSVVNVAVDIINFIDAVQDLNAMPPGPQKDFAIARVALAGTQLAVDTGLAILPVVASIAPATAPAIASFMGIAGPLSVVFAGLMIGTNALLEAIAFNNTHYQIELDEVIAPFRHSKNKTVITPTGIAQVSDDGKIVSLEPYVPLRKIRINGEILSVQVADIGIPRFNPANREHSTTYGNSLSAYQALGFDLSQVIQQNTALKSTQYLLLPAALDGHYNFMHDVGAYGRLDGKEIFNRFSAYYNSSGANVFHLGGDHAPNHAVFTPRATEYTIELDAGERSIGFQSPQKLASIKGDDHEGLHSGRLPTPMTDAGHAHFLTYRFKGGGGTTRIDLFDDRRQIIIQPHQDPVQRKNERWVFDITPDTLDAIANRKKTRSEWQQRSTMAYGEAVLALLNMGIDPADVSKVHDLLVVHIREAEIPGRVLLGGLGGFVWSAYNVIQSMSDPLSDLHTKVDLRTLMEAAEPFVRKLNEQDQASSMASQQSNIAQLGLEKRRGGWDLQLAHNKRVQIDGDLPGHIALQMRIVELPGLMFTLTASARPGEETPKFSVGLEAANREALLGNNLTQAVAFIQSKFANDPRFIIDGRVPIAIRIGENEMAKGLLDLTTQRWQAISNIERDSVTHPHFYNSQGDIAELFDFDYRINRSSFIETTPKVFTFGIKPFSSIFPWIIAATYTPSVAHIEYDTTQQQLAVVGVAHPFNNRKSRVDYRYFHDLPQNTRYQQLKAVYVDEENDMGQAPLMVLLDTLHTQSNQQMIPIKESDKASEMPMDIELAWDTEGKRFFRKATWQKDGYQFTTFATDASSPPRLAMTVLPPSTGQRQEWLTLTQSDIGFPISSLTLSLPPEISGIDLSALPAIPIKVFAPVGTKIRGLHHQTTLFLHTQGQPKVTLKLKKLPSPAPGTARTTAEVRLRWGLALMIDSQEALGSAINLAQINQALRTHCFDRS
ncbi:C80 family cysteine peptidase [Candidatus Fukatsuia endosymbiont of Tuberolachnus salignus]|uniref:C80 family cysteine peptidase n=1 Tax=Candidatus Fukatsuia endosymbiont of Tuberolachnus salignus TaxID=3077957 RepID=UPI00313B6F03